MDTSKMRLLSKMTSGSSYELLEAVRELGRVTTILRDSLESLFLREQIVEIVEELYDIGSVEEVYEIYGGYVNRNFGLVVQKDGKTENYFLRKYKKGIGEDEIRFEHLMINHLIANGFTIGAGVIPNKEGTTYVNPSSSTSMFAVYEFLKGEDKYTWDNPDLNDEEYVNSAEVLAIFHNAVRDFNPKGLARHEAKILDFVPTLPATFKKYAKEDRNTKFHKYYLENIDNIIEVIQKNNIDEEDVKKMPLNAVHCDFHPGNLKYENNKVVGIFDFDWSKIDLRLFEICLSLLYFCSYWDPEHDGELRLDKCAIFLKSYQDTLKKLDGLKPLNDVEFKNLPKMMALTNIYLINWEATDYYAKLDLNDYEYLAYLKHNVRLIQWIEEHKDEIGKLKMVS